MTAWPSVLRFAAAPPQSLGVQVRISRRLSSPAKAAKGAANRKGVTMKTDNPLPEHEPEHAESSTAYLLQEMALYGYRPYSDEPDDRPLPDARSATGACIANFDAMISNFINTPHPRHL